MHDFIVLFDIFLFKLFKTLDNMATPVLVKTKGSFLNPIFSVLDITICDFQSCILRQIILCFFMQ